MAHPSIESSTPTPNHRKATRKLGNEWYRSDERRYVYDGWNIVLELGGQEGALTQPWQSYLWGTDLSGTRKAQAELAAY